MISTISDPVYHTLLFKFSVGFSLASGYLVFSLSYQNYVGAFNQCPQLTTLVHSY